MPHFYQARRWFSPVSRSGKIASGDFLKSPLKSVSGSAIFFLYLCAQMQGLMIRAGRPLFEKRTSALFRFLTERSLTAMLNRIRALEHSTALANCALFASCGCEAYETEYNIRDG